MKTFLQSLYNDFRAGKNVDIYVSIVVGIILTLLGIFSIVSFTILATGILATLTLLLFSTLNNRRDEERLDNTLINLEQQNHLILTQISNQSSNIKASDVVKTLKDFEPLEAFILGSSQVFMTGVTLNTRTNRFKNEYKRMLDKGAHFQFIILDPKSPILPLVAKCQNTSTTALRSEIYAALDIFKDLIEYTKTKPTIGTFEFVAFNYAPTLTVLKTENAATGEIVFQVELPAYHSGIWERPVFRITQADRELFKYFNRVSTELWADATSQQKGKSSMI